jgi:hypothetical protein
MQRALAPLLFVDEERSEQGATRDPVAPATASASAKRKKSAPSHRNPDMPDSCVMVCGYAFFSWGTSG